MAKFAFEEEKLPEKLNLSVWKKVFRYGLKEWKLLLVCLLSTLAITFYDSSFVPVMNAGAINASKEMNGLTSIFDLQISVTFIFGIRVSLSYLGYIMIFIAMILFRSIAIFILFYFQNIVSMKIMTNL
ncbi:MAG TPA: hypothetical protein DCR94_03300, partial [Firmicutes bacterium]|nr:hypothetical protein [Bacillota bacterium]